MPYPIPPVALVGAGPGDPGLLTLRAVECLAGADLVLYDRLVPARILDFAPPGARRVCVTELAEHHVERCPRIHDVLIEAARRGQRVVRLKGGDPLVFGRGGEEADALRQAGIRYEIVPGVTSGLAAAACAGIPVTHRAHSSAVALVAGHEDPDKPESTIDWPALARFPGTLVIYMGMSHLPRIVQALLANGKAPATPAAVVEQATTGFQRTVEAPLADLAGATRKAGLAAPAIVLIGSVVGLRSRLAWFEDRPLLGKRILLTRPRHQADDLAHRLEQLGAITANLPVVEIRPPGDYTAVDRALTHLSRYDWLVFTSANGVRALIQRLGVVGKDLRALGHLKLAAIGPVTAQTLREFRLEPDIVPAEFHSEALAEALAREVSGKRILLARADRGRDVLREKLGRLAEVDQIAVYSQVDVTDADPEILGRLSRGEFDYVTLTSSNIARGFVRMLDAPARAHLQAGRTRLVSISPVTSAAIRELELPAPLEASEATSAGLVAALVGRGQDCSRNVSQDR